jgi:hypothetical protein
MIVRSYDPLRMQKALDMTDQNTGIDCVTWLRDRSNMMYYDDETGDVGLATLEYPGCYNLHWFFNSRGRRAITMANDMLGKFFNEEDVKLIRGLTPVDNKAACWLARKIGLTSFGVIDFPSGACELFAMTKDDFLKGQVN